MKNSLALFENFKIHRVFDEKTGRKVVTGENYLPPGSTKELD
jgi:hypothetical protein